MAENYYISRLFICNFKPFVYGNYNDRPYLEIDFKTAGEKASSIILSGPNGYGKTSIYQAICFTLTGMIGAGQYPDARKKVGEHLVINDIEKPSFTALELYDESNLKYLTIVRYTEKGKIGKIKEGEQEAKDFKAYIIEDQFDYSRFVEGEKKEVTAQIISNRLDERDISEWIARNYIQQDYEKNILLQDSAARVNFLNTFIEQETGKYFSGIKIEIENCNRQIEDMESDIQLLKEEIGQEVMEATGTPPLCEQVYPEMEFIWDKETYSEKDLFASYSLEVDKLLVISAHPEEYIECRKIELLNSILEYKNYFNQYVLGLYSSEKVDDYKAAYRKKIYWEKLVQDDNVLWNSDLETDYLDENTLDQINDARTKRNKWKNSLNDQQKLYDDIESYRNSLVGKEDTVQMIFDNVCPLCGSDFKENDRSLANAIQAAERIFENAKKLLGNALTEEKQGWKETELLVRKHLKRMKGEDTTKEQTYNDIVKIEQMASVITCIKNSLQELNNLYEDEELKRFSESELFQKEYEDIEEYKSAADNFTDTLNKLKEPIQAKQISINPDYYDAFKDDLTSLKEIGYRKEKLENKKKYLLWRENKKKALEYSEKKKIFNEKIQEIKNVYIKKYKLDKLLNCQKIAKDQYLNALLNYIEIPFYIYSGKLIQTYQAGLGLFCYSGKNEDRLTEFKIAVSKKKLEGQLDVTSKFSSGQKSVTNIALMLALKKIAKTNLDIFMIDDPCQSLDELNIASFVEIIKNEFTDTQIILSTHEDRIAGYISYKCKKAGKQVMLYDVQKKVYATADE